MKEIDVTIDMNKDIITLIYNGERKEITIIELWRLLDEKP